MKRYSFRILICCLLSVLLVTTTANESESLSAVAIIPAAVVGAIVLAGASMTPEQQSDYYGNLAGQISDSCAETGQLVRDVWQAREVTSTLGQTYLAGRANQIRGAVGGFYDHLKDSYNDLSDSLKGLIDDYAPVAPPPRPNPSTGDYVSDPNGTLQQLTLSYMTAPNCANPLWEAFWPHTWWEGSLFKVRVNGYDLRPACYSNGSIAWADYVYSYVTPDPQPAAPTWPDDPEPLPPAYCPFTAALAPAVASNPTLGGEIDDQIATSPPGVWNPAEPGDITDGEIIQPGVVPEPAPVEIPNETPDETIDNELLRGIYNNTLATARNTAKINDKVADVRDSIIALPGQIAPPIVGAIEALPGRIVPGIVDPIVAKLEEIKQEIPPPVESIVAEGNTPTLPANNNYDSSLENPEQLSLSGTILEFISNGLPFVSALGDNGIVNSSPVPRYSMEIYNHQLTFDFEPYEDYLRAMGVLLYSLTVIVCFAIIVRK
jgi:outer membrane murein-binding lipoprotein Lpp